MERRLTAPSSQSGFHKQAVQLESSNPSDHFLPGLDPRRWHELLDLGDLGRRKPTPPKREAWKVVLVQRIVKSVAGHLVIWWLGSKVRNGLLWRLKGLNRLRDQHTGRREAR